MARDMLQVTQFQALLVLAEAGKPITVGETGARMAEITGRPLYQNGALTTTLSRLEADELVSARSVPSGRRGGTPRFYSITPAGLLRLGETVGQFRKLVTVADGVRELARAA